MEKKFEPVKTGVAMAILFICTLVVYMIIGSAIYLPYAILARGNGHVLIFITIGPIVLFVFFIIGIFEYATKSARNPLFKWYKVKTLWIFTFWAMLPIFMNMFSVLLASAGHQSFGKILFEYRFSSMLLVFAMYTVYSITDILSEFQKK